MAGPTLQLRQLAHVLAVLRSKAGIDQDHAAAYLDCSSGKISHLESARYAPRRTDLRSLCMLYDANDMFAELDKLREGAKSKGWWSTFGLNPDFNVYLGLENDACKMIVNSLETIPGILQTEAYTRAILSLTKSENIDRQVAVRAQRRKLLYGDHPLELTVVMSEGALHRCCEEQLGFLLEQTEMPNITIHIMTFNQGLMGNNTALTCMSFPDDSISDVIYQESYMGAGHVIDEEKFVREGKHILLEIRDRALSPNESAEFISNFRPQH